MKRIVDIQLKHLQQLLAERKIVLDVDEKGEDLARQYRLRPGLWRATLKRVIQRALQNPLANMLLSGAIKDGDTSPSRCRMASSPSTAASLRSGMRNDDHGHAAQYRRRGRCHPRLSISALC